MGNTITSDWAQLLGDITACDLCADSLPLGPQPVLQFHPEARILVAAQAPGRRVHATGLPFNDPSGDRLRQWMGIERDTFYNPREIAIIPMGFCYPGTGPSGDLPPRPECAQTWHHQLLARLPNLELTLVIGQYAQAYHLGKSRKTLTQRVARWQDYWPDRLPMPHPSPRNNLWLKRNPWFEAEVIPALQERIEGIMRHS